MKAFRGMFVFSFHSFHPELDFRVRKTVALRYRCLLSRFRNWSLQHTFSTEDQLLFIIVLLTKQNGFNLSANHRLLMTTSLVLHFILMTMFTKSKFYREQWRQPNNKTKHLHGAIWGPHHKRLACCPHLLLLTGTFKVLTSPTQTRFQTACFVE